MSLANEAAQVFQEHREELGFVNTAQCEEKDLYTVSREGHTVGAALTNHCVRKPQTTLYDIAVLPEYRREGIAQELVDQIGRDTPHEKIVAKCPVDLPANEFYDNTGWVRVDREDGKNRALNVWQYNVESVDLVTTGRNDLTSYAEQYGWLVGSELSYIPHHERHGRTLDFIDMAWDDPKPDDLISACMKHEPKYAIAGDYEHRDDGELVGEPIEVVNERAELLTQWVDHPVVVPHLPGEPAEVPDCAIVGYSTPTRYGGTEAPLWEYQDKDVHVLGGTMNGIKLVVDHLGDSINSIDTNTMHRDATQFGEYWSQSTPARKRTAGTSNDIREAYENSILNMTYAFDQWGVIQ